MSLLVEIAARADVPLESVVRVLTREPVSDTVKARVLEVLDDLDADETRVLQRFALAAVHDVLPRPGDREADVSDLAGDELELPEKVVLELEAGEPVPETLPAPIEAAPLVQLGAVLTELTEAVRELRHETDAERRERVDDLAVLIDLITKGWEGVDRRLGRVERQLGRLDGAPRAAAIPARAEPPPASAADPPLPPPEGRVEAVEVEAAADEPDPERSTLRRRAPLIAALAIGVALGAILAIDLPSRLDASAVTGNRSPTAEAAQRAPLPRTVADQTGDLETAPAVSTPSPTRPEPEPTVQRTTTSAPKPPAPTTPAKTATQPAARPAPPAAPRTTTSATTAAPRTTTAPPRTTAPAATTAARPPQGDFTPSRNWAWPPVAGADYYFVEFFRAGQYLYIARPTVPRLTLPGTIRFVPGVYRWRVRAGRGAPSANRLDPPIVDSQFILNR